LTFLLYGALAGALFFLPFYLIQVLGFSATAAGATFLPFTILMGGFSRFVGALVPKIGARVLLIVGPTIDALAFVLFAIFAMQRSFWFSAFPGIVALGVGMTITVAPLTAAVMGANPAEKSGIASGINNAVSRVAGLFAVAIFGLVMVSVYTNHLSAYVVQLPSSDQAAIMSGAKQLLAAPMPSDLAQTAQETLRGYRVTSFLVGYQIVMWTCAAMAAASAVIAAFSITRVRKN